LAGCAGMGSVADPNAVGPFPADYRAIVERQIRAEFFDPASLQDVWIAAPFQGRLFFADGWMVCFRANGKNRMGAYTGQQNYGYLIRYGAVIQEGDQANCPNVNYTEWTEMEGAGWRH